MVRPSAQVGARRLLAILAGAGAFVLALRAVPGNSDEPLTSAVRFNREIVRILQSKCLACHERGSLGVSLASYQDARLWGRAMREEILERRMPPWPAAGGYGTFANEIRLTPRELGAMLSWLDGGMPRGDDADRPPPSTDAARREPDLRIDLPPQTIDPGVAVESRRMTVLLKIPSARTVTGVTVTPGDRRVIRSAFVYRESRPNESRLNESRIPNPKSRSSESRIPNPESHRDRRIWLGAWTPWHATTPLPDRAAQMVQPGSTLTIDVQYQQIDTRVVDRSVVLLYLSDQPATGGASELVITTDRAAGSGHLRARGEAMVAADSVAWALRPEADAGVQSLEVVAIAPDGAARVLLWIPRYDAEWKIPYVFRKPVALPARTKVRVTAYFTEPDAAAVSLALFQGPP